MRVYNRIIAHSSSSLGSRLDGNDTIPSPDSLSDHYPPSFRFNRYIMPAETLRERAQRDAEISGLIACDGRVLSKYEQQRNARVSHTLRRSTRLSGC